MEVRDNHDIRLLQEIWIRPSFRKAVLHVEHGPRSNRENRDPLRIAKPESSASRPNANRRRRILESPPVVGHVPGRVGVARVQAAGQLTLEHFIGFKIDAATRFNGGVLDLARVRELAAASRDAGVWHTPTITVAEYAGSSASAPRLSSARRRSLAVR